MFTELTVKEVQQITSPPTVIISTRERHKKSSDNGNNPYTNLKPLTEAQKRLLKTLTNPEISSGTNTLPTPADTPRTEPEQSEPKPTELISAPEPKPVNRGFHTLKQIPYTHSNRCVRVVVAEAGGSTRTQ